MTCHGVTAKKKHNCIITLAQYSRVYRNDPKFSDRQAWANSVDPKQTVSGSTLFAILSASFGLIQALKFDFFSSGDEAIGRC